MGDKKQMTNINNLHIQSDVVPPNAFEGRQCFPKLVSVVLIPLDFYLYFLHIKIIQDHFIQPFLPSKTNLHGSQSVTLQGL